MDGNDRFHLTRKFLNRRGETPNVDGETVGFYIDEYWCGAAGLDCRHGRYGGMRDCEHPIAGAYVTGAQSEFQRIGAVGHADRLRDAEVGCELRLKRVHLLTEYVRAALQHALDGRID